MGAVEDRLAELGLSVPGGRPARRGLHPGPARGEPRLHLRASCPWSPGRWPHTGKVGDGPGLVSPDDAKALAQACALNAIAAVKGVIGDLDQVTRVVKVVGFVASDPSFTGQPGVVNGASELLGKAFGDKGIHARSAVGVVALPLDAPVEVEIVVAVAG